MLYKVSNTELPITKPFLLGEIQGPSGKTPAIEASLFHVTRLATFWTALVQD